jgi:hypothetical protein
VIPRGYPHLTPRTKVALFPYVALAVLSLLALEDAGMVDLTAYLEPAAAVRPVAKHRPRPPAAAASSGAAPAGIPQQYLRLYREAGAGETWPDRAGRRYAAWAVLAGIGLVESGHGQSHAPGVRSGVNAFGCCAGPMQFNIRNGPPSTWDTWGQGGNPWDPADAIPAAARKLRGDGAQRDLDGALLSYNRSWQYVNAVKAQAARYQQGA